MFQKVCLFPSINLEGNDFFTLLIAGVASSEAVFVLGTTF